MVREFTIQTRYRVECPQPTSQTIRPYSENRLTRIRRSNADRMVMTGMHVARKETVHAAMHSAGKVI